jgi:hypothetical protein
MGQFTLDIGANPASGGIQFRVWEPSATSAEVELVGVDASKTPRNTEIFMAFNQEQIYKMR